MNQLPNTGQVMVIVLRDKVQMIHEGIDCFRRGSIMAGQKATERSSPRDEPSALGFVSHVQRPQPASALERLNQASAIGTISSSF